jgi:hypothetical protein
MATEDDDNIALGWEVVAGTGGVGIMMAGEDGGLLCLITGKSREDISEFTWDSSSEHESEGGVGP